MFFYVLHHQCGHQGVRKSLTCDFHSDCKYNSISNVELFSKLLWKCFFRAARPCERNFQRGVKRWARQPAIWPNPVGPSGEARRQSSNGAQRERIQVDERAKWRRVKMEAVMGSQTAWPLPCTPEQPAWKATTQLWWEKKKISGADLDTGSYIHKCGWTVGWLPVWLEADLWISKVC